MYADAYIKYDIMSALMDIESEVDFASWLQAEMNQRGWKQAGLARASGLSRQAVNDLIHRRRINPSDETLQAIADAFGYAPEFVYRKAGKLPEISTDTEQMEHIKYMLSLLDPDYRREAERYLEYLLSKQGIEGDSQKKTAEAT